jgi:hypothetical protein
MYYYIINGIELTLCFMPVYIENPYVRALYMTGIYFYFNSDMPYYYSELKNNLLKRER